MKIILKHKLLIKTLKKICNSLTFILVIALFLSSCKSEINSTESGSKENISTLKQESNDTKVESSQEISTNQQDSSGTKMESTLEDKDLPKDILDKLTTLQKELPKESDIDKDAMLTKMFNTGAYIYSAKGDYTTSDLNGGNLVEIKTNFEYKINKDGLPLSKNRTFLDEFYDNETLTATDGTTYEIDHKKKTYKTIKLYDENSYKNFFENTKIKNIEDIKNDTINPTGFSPFGVTDSLNMGITKNIILVPFETYNNLLLINDGNWNVTSNGDYLGFNSIKIQGSDKDANGIEASNYEIIVDSKTGVLLYYKWNNLIDKTYSMLQINNLEINTAINEEDFKFKNTDYKNEGVIK